MLADSMFGLVGVMEQVVDEVSTAEAFEQHVTCLGIDGDETASVGAKVVVCELGEVPVFELATKVAFAEWEGFLVIAVGGGMAAQYRSCSQYKRVWNEQASDAHYCCVLCRW